MAVGDFFIDPGGNFPRINGTVEQSLHGNIQLQQFADNNNCCCPTFIDYACFLRHVDPIDALEGERPVKTLLMELSPYGDDYGGGFGAWYNIPITAEYRLQQCLDAGETYQTVHGWYFKYCIGQHTVCSGGLSLLYGSAGLNDSRFVPCWLWPDTETLGNEVSKRQGISVWNDVNDGLYDIDGLYAAWRETGTANGETKFYSPNTGQLVGVKIKGPTVKGGDCTNVCAFQWFDSYVGLDGVQYFNVAVGRSCFLYAFVPSWIIKDIKGPNSAPESFESFLYRGPCCNPTQSFIQAFNTFGHKLPFTKYIFEDKSDVPGFETVTFIALGPWADAPPPPSGGGIAMRSFMDLLEGTWEERIARVTIEHIVAKPASVPLSDAKGLGWLTPEVAMNAADFRRGNWAWELLEPQQVITLDTSNLSGSSGPVLPGTFSNPLLRLEYVYDAAHRRSQNAIVGGYVQFGSFDPQNSGPIQGGSLQNPAFNGCLDSASWNGPPVFLGENSGLGKYRILALE